MFSFLARPRALALLFSLSTLTTFSHALQDSLFTSSVTYCNPPETLLIQRFEVAYFPANNSVSFNVSAASVQANVNVTANLFLNVYGMNPVNVTLDLCGILGGALCPLPMYNFTGADSITLPSSLSVVDSIPKIAYIIPDLEGFAQLTLTDVKTGDIKACVQATLANGRSAHQPSVEWTTGGVTLAALLIAAWQSILSPDAIIPFRLLELMYLYQSIASSAFLNLNYPSVYRAFALNFSWAMGLIPASLDSSLQNSINRMRHLTGGNLADAIGGSAVSLVNRKLSPYNSPNANFVSNSFGAVIGRALVSDFPADLSKLGFGPNAENVARDTIVNGIVQTVTAESSNVLQAGLPIYVNTIHIATANAFMTAFFLALIVLAVAMGVFILGYGIIFLVERVHSRKHNGGMPLNFDYQSFIISWFIRLALVMAFPLSIFVFYQWTLKDSWLSVLLSVLSFCILSAAIVYPSFLTLRLARQDSPSALYARNTPQLNRNGPLYAQYRLQRYFFFVPFVVAFYLRAVAISFAQASGEAQLALLIIIEAGFVLAHFVLKPAHTRGGDVFGTYLAILRLVSTALMIAFLEKLEVKAIPRVVVGIVIALAWSIAVLVVIGNILWNGIAAIKFRGNNGRSKSPSILESPTGSEGSMLEKGFRGMPNGSSKSNFVAAERSLASDPGDHLPHGGESMDADSIEEVARARPINPTPENNIPFDQYIYTPYPISPTATVSTMEPPSIYSRDSGTITVGSLLPRRWSFSFSQPGSPVGSTYQRRSSLTPSPMPPSTPSDASHSGGVSRNTSMRVQQHQPRHEDIQEELETSFSSSSTATPAIS